MTSVAAGKRSDDFQKAAFTQAGNLNYKTTVRRVHEQLYRCVFTNRPDSVSACWSQKITERQNMKRIVKASCT